MTWIKSTTKTGNGTTVTTDTFTAKIFLNVLEHVVSSGDTIDVLSKANGDTGSNYAYRVSDNGGADSTLGSATFFMLGGGNAVNNDSFSVHFIFNRTVEEKLVISFGMGRNTAGAVNVPTRRESVTKWANTTSQITSLDLDPGAGTCEQITNISVLGTD